MKRKVLSKKQRQEIFDRTNGRCGYCGCELQKGWHADHMESFASLRWKKKLDGDMDNYMASCPQCNNYKHCMSVEAFRKQLGKQLELCTRHSVNYRFAVKYGLVEEVKKDIVFYFESIC